MSEEFLQISPRISVLPIIHGSGDFAIEVRRLMLSRSFDCLAVPLPESFQADVERAIDFLPGVSAVIQEETNPFKTESWSAESDDDGEERPRTCSYVPIDPCQGVIAAIRIALQERIPRAFIDIETEKYIELSAVLPDPYALKTVPAERFAAAVLPALPRLPEGQPRQRVNAMAARLRELETHYKSILFVCSMLDWPWVREAYTERVQRPADEEAVEETELLAANSETLLFLLGELPFITGLYERARSDLDDDENLSVDGLKELLLTTRDRYQTEFASRARKITPKLLATYFCYIRNLALIERRLTPDLYTLVTAAQQIFGDQFAVQLAACARDYLPAQPTGLDEFTMGIHRARIPDGDLVAMKNRLPGNSVTWRSCSLKPVPPRIQQDEWKMRWNPFQQCSWPPEDVAIERFRTHVKDVALTSMGADLARTEKFSTSLKDGLDIRETLRNWYDGELYVKVLPPTRGTLDCVVMLFDSPADPRDYPYRVTWHAEHHDESTLALFATNFMQEMVGPGIGLASYGGAMFLFPPRPVPDIWRDPRFEFTDTLEEKILAAALYYSNQRHIALLSDAPPGAGWRRLARRYHKKIVHVPLNRFSQATVQQLRLFHVLNGRQIRSFATHFIRKA